MENFLSAYEEFQLRTYGSILPVDEVHEIEQEAREQEAAEFYNWIRQNEEMELINFEFNH